MTEIHWLNNFYWYRPRETTEENYPSVYMIQQWKSSVAQIREKVFVGAIVGSLVLTFPVKWNLQRRNFCQYRFWPIIYRQKFYSKLTGTSFWYRFWRSNYAKQLVPNFKGQYRWKPSVDIGFGAQFTVKKLVHNL